MDETTTPASLEDLIAEGETDDLEFKSSIRWDYREQRQRLTMRAIELALSGDLQALKMCLERILAMPQLPTPVRPSYDYATMGEFIAWIIGWDLILEYAFGATTVAIGCYVTSFLCAGLEIPARFSVAPLAYDPAVGAWSPPGAPVNLPAIFIIILITILLVVGIRDSAKVNNVIVAISW